MGDNNNTKVMKGGKGDEVLYIPCIIWEVAKLYI